MDVKWKVILSKMCHLPGRGPQGGTLGIEEYPSQNNDNVEFQPDDKKIKFIDDLSILEIINLLSIGFSSYDYNSHAPSDIGTDNFYLKPQNTKVQAGAELGQAQLKLELELCYTSFEILS